MSINVGIVGLGDGGLRNLESLQSAGAKVVAACDINTEAFDAVRAQFGYGIKFYHTADDLATGADVDLVVVATPDHLHIEPTRVTLEAGKYVFLEKPAVTTLDDLSILKNLVLQYPSKVLFGERYSFARPIQAVLSHEMELGRLMFGNTFYIMGGSDRAMGGGKWRTEHAYNPCAGGLSHNFMTILLFSHAPIIRVSAIGQVLTYHENLDRYSGYDTMSGVIEFATGICLQWSVCLALREEVSIYRHRDITHLLQFENGGIAYGSTPEGDQLTVNGRDIPLPKEPNSEAWKVYSLMLYQRMHQDILRSIEEGTIPLHNITQGINVAAACILAFESARQNGVWLDIPSIFVE